MEGRRLLHKLCLTNFLSYGPEGEEVELQPLNVLIGPNGSGKSNFIQAIGLLRAAPKDVTLPIRTGGGMPEWPWKGGAGSPAIDLELEAIVSYAECPVPLRYRIGLMRAGQGLEISEECIENERMAEPADEAVTQFYTNQPDLGEPRLNVRESSDAPVGTGVGRRQRRLSRGELNASRSILSQRRDPDKYPELTYLADVLQQIQLYRSCQLGPNSALLGPQRADLPAGSLLEDGSNLGMVLNDLFNRPNAKARLLSELERFYEYVEDINQRVVANTIETAFVERGLYHSIPSVRLSDGTLRYLCLLTVLCHPSPPPLVCIEDPEIALHPDALPRLAELLVEASQRTQLVVTTHSDVLVSALTHVPEAVVVCERDENGSHLRRLDADGLSAWLDKYKLGELWISGEIGGESS